MEHKSPAKTENLRYLDFIWYTGAIRRNLGLSDATLSGDSKRRLEEVSQRIEKEFTVDIDLVNKAEIKLTRRESLLELPC